MYDNVNIITNEKTIEYLNLYKTGKDECREKIIIGHIPLVKHLVYNYFKSSFNSSSFEDLVEFGIIGLMKAIDYYNPSKNAKFSTFAYICVKSELLRYVSREKRSVSCLSLDNTFINNKALLIPDDINLENSYIEQEMLEFLKSNLVLLPSCDFELLSDVYGFYQKKLTLKELSNKYGCSRGTIIKRVDKIITSLKQQLLDYGYEEKVNSLHI